MKKVLSFCLFGDNPKYWRGAVDNARLARQLYPGWEVWVHADRTVPYAAIMQLRDAGAVIIWCDGIAFPKLWRFIPVTARQCDMVVVRDSDSRLSACERACVADWEKTSLPIHVIRSRSRHAPPSEYRVMAGLCGFRPRKLELPENFQSLCSESDYRHDELWLRRHVEPLLGPKVSLEHDLDWWNHANATPPPVTDGIHELCDPVQVFSPKVCCLTVFDPLYAPVGELCYQRLNQYAFWHGYKLECCRDPIILPEGRESSWAKVLSLRRELDNPSTDYVMWFDADSLVVNIRRSVESIVSADKDASIWVSVDGDGICCSHIIVKNCDFSRRFLETLWFMGDTSNPERFHKTKKHEQDAFKALYYDFPSIKNNIRTIPAELVNHRYEPATGSEPFVAHFPMTELVGREKLMRESFEKTNDKLTGAAGEKP